MSKIPAKRKAPPPDRPLNVGGYGIHFPSQIKTKTPDWNFWGAMPKATHLQACILSIGIDPDSLRILDRYSIEILPIETQETLKKRLKLLAANSCKPTIFTLPMAQYSGLNTGEVFLSEFAAWGVSLGWDDMPQELSARAQEQAVIAPKVAPVAEPPPQSATQERFASLRFRELWSEGELQSIMCGDAGRLFGSGHSASDIEREDARGAILDGIGVESLIVNDWRQVESKEWMVPPATVRYFKPDQAIAWVNRDRFPKFPFPASEVMPPASKPQAAAASEQVTPAAVLTLPPAEAQVLRNQETVQTTMHKIKHRPPSILDAEISLAKKQALNSSDKNSVWAELVKMAEKKIGCLLGMDGKEIKYQSGESVLFFKKRSFNERMNRATTH